MLTGIVIQTGLHGVCLCYSVYNSRIEIHNNILYTDICNNIVDDNNNNNIIVLLMIFIVGRPAHGLQQEVILPLSYNGST